MSETSDTLNASLWALLHLTVRDTGALTADGTFIQVFVRDERGRAAPPPDMAGDVAETIRHLPPGVEMRLRYSPHFEAWACLLVRDAEIYEAMADTEALAAARAFKQLLAFDAAAAQQAEKARTT